MFGSLTGDKYIEMISRDNKRWKFPNDAFLDDERLGLFTGNHKGMVLVHQECSSALEIPPETGDLISIETMKVCS